MDRRHFLGALASAPAAAAPARPNVILALADDQGWGDTSYNGHPVLRTPHLDAMARDGVRFDRFYSGAPVCSPTRGSCLTGRHPYRYGVFFANADTGADAPSKYALPAREVTLAEAVKTLGYATAHFGKWHLGDFTGPGTSGPAQHGFDEFFSTTRKVSTLDPDGYWTRDGRLPALRGDDSTLIMDRALDFIQRSARRRQPFFAVLWFHTPHVPFAAGPAHRAPYAAWPESVQHYYGALAALDEQMGRLRAELRRLGLQRDTMLWYASDNGPEGDRQEPKSPGSAGPFRGRKRSLFEGGIRVPALLEWPARFPRPFTTKLAASTSDYFPTVLAALGAPPHGAPLDGLDLLPLLERRATRRGSPLGFETINDTRGSGHLAWIEDRYKLITELDRPGEEMLFDLERDPGERDNLAAARPAEADRLRRALVAWRASCTESRKGL